MAGNSHQHEEIIVTTGHGSKFSEAVHLTAAADLAEHLCQFEQLTTELNGRTFDVRWRPNMREARWQFDNHIELLTAA